MALVEAVLATLMTPVRLRPQRWDSMASVCAVLAVGMLLLALAGCRPPPTPTATPPPTVDPREVMRRAVDRMLQLESASFTLEHQRGSSLLFPGLEINRVDGVVDIPDRFRMTVEGQSALPRSFVETQIVTIGDRAYMTDFLTGRWQEVPPEILPFNLANLGQTMADIINAVDSPTMVGSERVRGYNAYRIKGRVQSQELSTLVPGAGQGFDVGLELWLDQSDGLLLRGVITGKVLDSDIPDAVRLLTLNDFDLAVDITPPI